MAVNGDIPKHLPKIDIPPKCDGCLFGALTKVAWKSGSTHKPIYKATKPGEVVSVDQMISTQVNLLLSSKVELPTHGIETLLYFLITTQG